MSLVRHFDRPEGVHAALASACAVVVDGHFSPDVCQRWVEGVYRGRADWTHDFGGEQFCLGRAFYTHFEEDRSGEYFDDVASSDARVEAHAPALQTAMREVASAVIGDDVRLVQRRGWCGPGVHVFPPGGPVAERGGVCHSDTEGLAAKHLAARKPAITLVAMLQTAATSGGLKVWNAKYDGEDHPDGDALGVASEIVPYRVGDVLLIDSYQLHQIQPFSGTVDRISATVHAAQIDRGMWECWF